MLMTIICNNCGIQIEKQVYPSRVPLFCSKGCGTQYMHTGLKRSQITRQKQSLAKQGLYNGKNNPNYGKHFSKEVRDKISRIKRENYLDKCKKENKKPFKRTTRPKKFERWARQIKIRDNFTCQLCHERGGKLRSHHIKSWKDYPNERYKLENGITMCYDCHIYTHNVDVEAMQ